MRGCRCFLPCRPINMAYPGEHECFVVVASAFVVSIAFWVVSLVDTYRTNMQNSAMIAMTLESTVDIISTLILLARFWNPGSLNTTPLNSLNEVRASVAVSICLIVLATILMVEACIRLLFTRGHPSKESITFEVVLSFPSAILYLVLGMLQLSLGWRLRTRSLKQDGLTTILGATVSLGALMGALVNLLTCTYTSELDAQEHHGESLTAGPEASEGQTALQPSAVILSGHRPKLHYPYFWVEDAITLTLAIVILIYSISEVVADTLDGTPSLVERPVPPPAHRS